MASLALRRAAMVALAGALTLLISGCPLPDARFKDLPGYGGAGGQGGSGGGSIVCSMESGPCPSGVCKDGVCQPATCSDSVQNGEETGVDCGGPPCLLCPTVLLLAGGGSDVRAGEFHTGSPWIFTKLTEATSVTPAITLTSLGGVGLVRSNANGGELGSTLWTAPDGFGALNALGPSITAQTAPAMTSAGEVAHAAFHSNDFKYFYASYQSGAWMPASERVSDTGLAVDQSHGPTPPSITTLGDDVFIAFAGDDGDLYDQQRTGGAWEAAKAHNLLQSVQQTPAITTLTTGPDLMIVFIDEMLSKGQLYWTTRVANIWSFPLMIDSAISVDPVSLASLPDGDVALAYRAKSDNKIYTASFTSSWTAPLKLSDTVAASRPALSRGTGGTKAELVFVDGTGKVFHSRLTGTAWMAPVDTGLTGAAGLTHIAIAAGP